MYFLLHESIKWLCSSGMQQQQPGTVKHSRISSLLISRHLSRPRVASRYSVWTFMWPEVGVATKNFQVHFTCQWLNPPPKFLNPPLHCVDTSTSKVLPTTLYTNTPQAIIMLMKHMYNLHWRGLTKLIWHYLQDGIWLMDARDIRTTFTEEA